MSDLDVIREARDYLAGLIEQSEKFDPVPWVVDADRPGRATVNDPDGYCIASDAMGAGAFALATARLIRALRAAAPLLIEALDTAITWQDDDPDEFLRASAWDAARAILATKGQDHD